MKPRVFQDADGKRGLKKLVFYLGKCLREKIEREPGKARRAIRRRCKSDLERGRRKLGGSDLKIAT